MSLSDVVGAAGLTTWAEVALVIFFVVFLGIVYYVFSRRRGAWEHERHLPLDDGRPQDALEDRRR